MRRALPPALLLLGSVLFSVAIVECGLRLHRTGTLRGFSGEHSLRMPHETRGWALAPDATSFQRTRDYAVLVRTNSLGMRDRPHDPLPAPGTFRIVVLGDSFMEAYQVPLEQSLPYLLQERLASRGVEVLNLGVGGYGTAQQLVVLREEGLGYRPQLVVLAFFTGNDVQNNSYEIEAALHGEEEPSTFSRPYARASPQGAGLEWRPPDRAKLEPYARRWYERRNSRLDALRRLLQPAMVANVVEQATARLWSLLASRERWDPQMALGWPFLRELSDPHAARLWQDAWMATRRLLLEIDREARRGGASLVVLIVPTPFQVDPRELAEFEKSHPELDFDALRINRELQRFCARAGIPLLDPTDAFARERAAGLDLYYTLEDRHWNAAGQALATDLLAEFLVERGLVPPPGQAAALSTSR